MKKALIFAVLALLFVLPLTGATTYCANADKVVDVDLKVVGDGCHWSNQIQDSESVSVDNTATYTVTGVVHRGNPGQCQTNEAFTLTMEGQTGPVVHDDPDPCAEVTVEEYVGTFNLVAGTTTAYMNTASQCPPDIHPNSVEVTQLCFYENGDGEVPEFGLIGAVIAVAGIAGFAIFKRKH